MKSAVTVWVWKVVFWNEPLYLYRKEDTCLYNKLEEKVSIMIGYQAIYQVSYMLFFVIAVPLLYFVWLFYFYF